jgi:hypothetical protein
VDPVVVCHSEIWWKANHLVNGCLTSFSHANSGGGYERGATNKNEMNTNLVLVDIGIA